MYNETVYNQSATPKQRLGLIATAAAEVHLNDPHWVPILLYYGAPL